MCAAPINSAPEPAVAPRLSIVVLPFANLSNDPEQQYFADGITEDLTTDLSRIAGMFVLTLEGDRIAALTRFGDGSVLPRFGLPRTLPW